MQTLFSQTGFCDSSLWRAVEALFDPKIEVFSGYPANCSTWLTLCYQRKSQRWSLEWYERPGFQRPQMLQDRSACLMQEVLEHGALPEEWAQARSLLRDIAFFEA